MNLENIPPVERKLPVWEFAGKFYTPEELAMPSSLSAFESLRDEVFKTLKIDEYKLTKIAKERAKKIWSNVKNVGLATLTFGKEKVLTPQEILEKIELEEGIGKKIIEVEKKRVLNVLSKMMEG